jgi:hypothetical protein
MNTALNGLPGLRMSVPAPTQRRSRLRVPRLMDMIRGDTAQPSLYLGANFKKFRHRAVNSPKRLSALLITNQLLRLQIRLTLETIPARPEL